LLGGLSVLENNERLNVLMFHGPLVYTVHFYMGHTPFTEGDIDKLLSQYGAKGTRGREIKEAFLKQAFEEIYPKMTRNYVEWNEKRIFEPLSFMAYLLRLIITEAKKKNALVIGIVERATKYSEFSKNYLLERVFQGLRKKNNIDFFNNMFGRKDLRDPETLLNKLGYTDSIFMSLLLEPEEYSEVWTMTKQYEFFSKRSVSLPNSSLVSEVDYSPLQSGPFGFPKILGSYLKVGDNIEPIRVETFAELGDKQMEESVKRVYRYSKLLPQYGFPVGLDIADKFAHVPDWLKQRAIAIHYQTTSGRDLQSGEIN
jgi:hypothetical protein